LATPIAVDGTPTSATIDPGADEDWLALACDAGHRYELTTYSPSGTFLTRVQLVASDCATVLAEWVTYNFNELSFFVGTTDLYYLKVASADGAQVGQIYIGVTDRGPQADDHSGMQSGATPIPADGSVLSGAIDYPGDYDYFTFDGLPDHLYAV